MRNVGKGDDLKPPTIATVSLTLQSEVEARISLQPLGENMTDPFHKEIIEALDSDPEHPIRCDFEAG